MIPRRQMTRPRKKSVVGVDWTQHAMATGKKQDAASIFRDNAQAEPGYIRQHKELS